MHQRAKTHFNAQLQALSIPEWQSLLRIHLARKIMQQKVLDDYQSVQFMIDLSVLARDTLATEVQFVEKLLNTGA